MKQYVSFQRFDIICSIQCLTEFYLKHFLPDLLLIQLGGLRKGGKFSVCEHTHGIAVLHRVGKVVQNHHDRFIRKDRKEKQHIRLLHGILCDSLIFMNKCTPKFKKYGILVQNWFHRGE